MTISYSDIKTILNKHIPQGQWVHISDIHNLVKKHYNLSNEDWKPHTSSRLTNYPLWKARVQGVLTDLKAKGFIQHNVINHTYKF